MEGDSSSMDFLPRRTAFPIASDSPREQPRDNQGAPLLPNGIFFGEHALTTTQSYFLQQDAPCVVWTTPKIRWMGHSTVLICALAKYMVEVFEDADAGETKHVMVIAECMRSAYSIAMNAVDVAKKVCENKDAFTVLSWNHGPMIVCTNRTNGTSFESTFLFHYERTEGKPITAPKGCSRVDFMAIDEPLQPDVKVRMKECGRVRVCVKKDMETEQHIFECFEHHGEYHL